MKYKCGIYLDGGPVGLWGSSQSIFRVVDDMPYIVRGESAQITDSTTAAKEARPAGLDEDHVLKMPLNAHLLTYIWTNHMG